MGNMPLPGTSSAREQMLAVLRDMGTPTRQIVARHFRASKDPSIGILVIRPIAID